MAAGGTWGFVVRSDSGPRKDGFQASRQRLGVRERTFFQPTPMGDMIVATLEGDDPVAASEA